MNNNGKDKTDLKNTSNHKIYDKNIKILNYTNPKEPHMSSDHMWI